MSGVQGLSEARQIFRTRCNGLDARCAEKTPSSVVGVLLGVLMGVRL